jgi:hypothetical protein
MVRQFGLSVLALMGLVAVASAQQAKGAVGTWNAQTLVGPRDSVVATYVFTVAKDGKSATLKFPNHDLIPARILAMAGDSIVVEAGPYPSVLKPGLTVNKLSTVAHVKGDNMTGNFVANYSNGDVVKGKIKGARAKS